MRNMDSFKRLLCLGIAAGGLLAGPALADDYATGSSTSSSVPRNWTGPYVGGFVGGSFADFANNTPLTGPSGSTSSFMGGGDVGTNWQFNRAVLGVEGDFSKLNNHSGTGTGIKYTEDWMTTVRGRAGFAIGRFLPYVTGGLALTDTVSKVSGVGSSERVEPGPAAGGGVDAMLANNWFARVEYLYTGVPKETSTIGGTTVGGGSANNAVRLGLNYKF